MNQPGETGNSRFTWNNDHLQQCSACVLYLRLSVNDNNKTVWLVKVVKQLNDTVNMSDKLQ